MIGLNCVIELAGKTYKGIPLFEEDGLYFVQMPGIEWGLKLIDGSRDKLWVAKEYVTLDEVEIAKRIINSYNL